MDSQPNNSWNHYTYIDTIPEDTLGINVCTMDFSIKLRTTPGELPSDRAFHELIRNPKLIKDEFTIKREEILPFLSSLEEAAGGRGTFRHLTVDSPHIRDNKWNLKFLNLYLSPLNNGFIVCDRNSRAIRWKEIIPNIIKKELYKQNTTENKQ